MYFPVKGHSHEDGLKLKEKKCFKVEGQFKFFKLPLY